MIFHSEHDKEEFSKAPPVLQVMVSCLEFEAAKFQAQLEYVGYEVDVALVAIDPITFSHLQNICSHINTMFKRKDRFTACAVVDVDGRVVKCVATKADDLQNLI